MDIRIEPYAPEHVAAVRSFNARLGEQRSSFRLSESAPQHALRARPPHREEYLALDDGQVRGGFALNKQQFWINGQAMEIGHCQLPISEGTFNPAYANLGLLLLRQALRIQPRLFCLGMGSRQNRLPRMLSAMRWTLIDIPFLFRVHHAAGFLRNIAPLRTTRSRRLILDAMAVSGIGSLAMRGLQVRRSRVRSVSVEPVVEFESWADALWDRCKTHLSLSSIRSSTMLNSLYSSNEGRFLRLKMSLDGEAVGWVVLRDTQMRDHRYFGNMRVGTIIDGMAMPNALPSVIEAATNVLEARGVDLTISNQANDRWVRSLRKCGFLSGPSNYILAMSPKLTALLEPLAEHKSRLHLNRGDGDGPLDL